MNGTLRAFFLIAVLGCAGLFVLLYLQFNKASTAPMYGATFSPAYAGYLGLDPHEVFVAALTDLPIRQIRLPLQWNDIQPTEDTLYFEDIDWYLDTAAAHNVHVTLAVGNKVPRWPECYTPDWAKPFDQQAYEQALLKYLDTTVTRYRTHPALERWQIENEPLFPFGNCPKSNFTLVKKEIAHVRALDDAHPVQLTVSGEQQIWASIAKYTDVLGASMYRKVALPNGWRFTFPIPARVYSLQTLSVSFLGTKVVISELQAEPWLTRPYGDYTPAEAAALFTPDELLKNLRYAHRTGIQEISLWGVEWWYYLKQNGEPALWQSAQELLRD
ncbi:MAG TPA: beta-galactosidase [bacterium]|nr:beta-galactosidase [bacterium]